MGSISKTSYGMRIFLLALTSFFRYAETNSTASLLLDIHNTDAGRRKYGP